MIELDVRPQAETLGSPPIGKPGDGPPHLVNSLDGGIYLQVGMYLSRKLHNSRVEGALANYAACLAQSCRATSSRLI